MREAARPIELYCHDYAAAYKTFFGLKPKYKDEEGFVKKLTGDMMRFGHRRSLLDAWLSSRRHDQLCRARHGELCR